jgi:dihydrofolate reductase / thymidylate synthase
MINLILACDSKYGIGKNNKLPWHFSDDLKYFKRLTEFSDDFNKKSCVIMGRKTWESIPNNYLKNRINIVISRNKEITDLYKSENEKILFFDSLIFAINYSKKNFSNVWIIGGSDIYNQSFNYYLVDYIYLTQINCDFKCDKFIKLPKYKLLNHFSQISKNKNDNLKYELNFKKLKINYNAESLYLKLLKDVLDNGEKRQTRNGITKSIFSKELKFNLNDGFPLLTTKRMFWKGIVEELLFFIRGDTDTKKLEEKGVKIWKGNTNQEFLDKMGFDYKEGNMGPMYGYQWRNFNSMEIDQLKNVIQLIKTDPNSRRILMTDYNPAQVHLGVLYPCHSLILQFYVNKKNLSVKMYQRSADAFLGLPFNIASTSLLLCIISKLTNLDPYEVTITLGDCHIYEEHYEAVNKQLSRTCYNLPEIELPDFKSLEEVERSELKDYKIVDYEHHSSIKAKMIA